MIRIKDPFGAGDTFENGELPAILVDEGGSVYARIVEGTVSMANRPGTIMAVYDNDSWRTEPADGMKFITTRGARLFVDIITMDSTEIAKYFRDPFYRKLPRPQQKMFKAALSRRKELRRQRNQASTTYGTFVALAMH